MQAIRRHPAPIRHAKYSRRSRRMSITSQDRSTPDATDPSKTTATRHLGIHPIETVTNPPNQAYRGNRSSNPGEIMKELDQLVEAVDAVLDLNMADIPVEDVADNLRALVRQAQRVQAAIVAHTATMTIRRAHAVTGRTTTTAFLTQDCHYAGREAAKLTHCAEQLEAELPHTAAALRTGEINWNHAVTVVRANGDLGTSHVRAHEADWIQNVAVHSGPERLQRVVRARLDERGLARSTSHHTKSTEVPYPAPSPVNCTEEQAPLAETRAPLVPAQSRSTLATQDGQQPKPTPITKVGRDVVDASRVRSLDLSKAQMPPGAGYGFPSDQSGYSALLERHCLHAGCGQAPEWRHVHHTIHWQDGTEAVVTTLTPVCRSHFAEIDDPSHAAVVSPFQRAPIARNTPEHVA